MNFAQLEYPIFLLVVVSLIWVTPKLELRKVIALLASCYFYAYWDYRFLLLLFASTALDFTVGHLLTRSQTSHWRKTWLALSVLGNLGVLGFFKYYNFFIESAEVVWSAFGWHAGTLQLVLPIGISFYTFQTLSYSIDVYRRQLPATNSLLDFALYVMFFPQLVAGPIVRASTFLPQLAMQPTVCTANLYPGLAQILRGYVKKVLIADHLAMMVDPVFDAPHVFSSVTVALAILAYAGQIYGDFAGYSDIAVGSARLLGFELPPNFAHPYLATSMSGFWRRWHMTLSTWLRDYVYIPLGGSRFGEASTYRNLLITMLLGGLWHGAAWTFVLWGVWHGVVLALERAITGINRSERIRQRSAGLVAFGGWCWMSGCVLFGWTLFRSQSILSFTNLWQSLLDPSPRLLWLPPFPLIALSILMLEHLVWMTPQRDWLQLDPRSRCTPWLVGFALAAIALFAPLHAKPFVYFQF